MPPRRARNCGHALVGNTFRASPAAAARSATPFHEPRAPTTPPMPAPAVAPVPSRLILVFKLSADFADRVAEVVGQRVGGGEDLSAAADGDILLARPLRASHHRCLFVQQTPGR
jgi:hypothetical protein